MNFLDTCTRSNMIFSTNEVRNKCNTSFSCNLEWIIHFWNCFVSSGWSCFVFVLYYKSSLYNNAYSAAQTQKLITFKCRNCIKYFAFAHKQGDVIFYQCCAPISYNVVSFIHSFISLQDHQTVHPEVRNVKIWFLPNINNTWLWWSPWINKIISEMDCPV